MNTKRQPPALERIRGESALCAVVFALGIALTGPKAWAKYDHQPRPQTPDRDLEFRSAIVEMRSADAVELRKALQLRLPKLEIITWSSDRKQASPPFVLIRILPDPKTPEKTILRLLTDQGRMYERPLTLDIDRQDPMSRPHDVAREIASFLLAIQEGLVAPKAQSVELKPSPQPAAPVPETKAPIRSAAPQKRSKPAPARPSPPNPQVLPPPKPPFPWSIEITPLILSTPPPPRFEQWWGGAGLSLAANWNFHSDYFLHLEGRWVRRKHRASGIGLHRLRFASGLGRNLRAAAPSLYYRPLFSLAIEAWQTQLPAIPTPQPQPNSGALVSLSLSQSLMWRVLPKTPSQGRQPTPPRVGLEIGPSLEIAYGFDLHTKGRAVGIHFVPDPNKSQAVARVGGLEIAIGAQLRLLFLRSGPRK